MTLLCKKHGKPILPSMIRSGCKNVGCGECKKEWMLNHKDERDKKWEEHYKRKCHCKVCCCARHPSRRCNKARYIRSDERRCASCVNRRADGTKRRAYVKALYWNSVRGNAKKALIAQESALEQGYEPGTWRSIHSV